MATGHPADKLRKEVLKDAYHFQKGNFTKEPTRADELLKIGESLGIRISTAKNMHRGLYLHL